jgi:pyruvate/2-oxoglutarate dehydrogenase complex dihydrolipoamide dehydrogenase (E3) component
MTNYDFDFLAIGSGAAGSSAVTAIDAHRYRVGMAERGKLGGTCLNYGCDPTKTMLHIAWKYYAAQHSSRFGLHCAQTRLDWAEMQQFVHEVIHRLRGGSVEEARAGLEKQGIHLLQGEAVFVSPHEVQIDGKTISAERILIATGSETLVPPVEGLQETGYITNVQAVSLPELPRRLAVVGGGAIGIEFAQMFHRFGCEVTVLERSPMILDKEDRELADKLCDLLAKEGLRLETSAELKKACREGGAKKLTIQCGERSEEELVVDEILMAVGRKAIFESLRLERAGVKTTMKGVEVDATLRTSSPHIWAAGDVASPFQFTHIASAQGQLVACNAFTGGPQPFDDRAISWVTFTDPPLAHLGKTEQELREQGVQHRVARMLFDQNERAITMGKTEGIVKLLIDGQNRLLGAHILAERGDDLLAPLVLTMHAQLPIDALASTLMPYPTLSESVAKVAGIHQKQ